jgi:RND family efflux transporter MFP subunit
MEYVAPQLDPTTGTILVRGLFANPERVLLPGFFVRVRVPTDLREKAALVVPDRVIGEDQAGRYLFVVNNDDIVEQRRITTGPLLVGGLRVVESGLNANDRVVVTTNGRAIPGRKVVPKATTIQAPPSK